MWETTTVGNTLLMLQNGVNCKQDKSGEGYKITRIETIASAKINYEKTGFAMLDKAQLSKARLEVGDILFSHINSSIHVGKTAIYNGEEPLWHGINLLRLRTVNEVNSNYFNYFLISLFWSGYWKKTSKQSINQASVNQTDIKSIPISYPPLPEQQRIVAKLDSTFTEIDTAIAATEKKQKEAIKLKQAILTNILHPQTPAKTWKTEKLGDVIIYEKQNGQGTCLPYVGMENISSSSMQLIGEVRTPEKTSTTFKFNKNHVLFGRLRPYLQKILIPTFEGKCSTEIFCIRPFEQLDRKYLAYWLLSPVISQSIDATSTGARMPRANMNAILNFDFTFPPLAKQKKIVEKLDTAFTEIDNFTQATKKKIKNYKALKSAILTQELQPKK